MSDYYTDQPCNGGNGAKIVNTYLIEWVDKKAKRKYDYMNRTVNGQLLQMGNDFLIECIEDGRARLIRIGDSTNLK